MMTKTNLIGQRFGKLVVIGKDEEKSKQNTCYWAICKCDCGNIVSVKGTRLTYGMTKSCGCYKPNRRFTEIYMNDKSDYGIAFVKNGDNDDYFVVFDKEDKDIVQNGAWRIDNDGYLCGFARGSHSDSKSVLLHRSIASKYHDINGKLVDHINHNPYDVRHNNLRPCTAAENALNRTNYNNNPDKPIGMRNINYNSKTDRYVVAFRINKDGKYTKHQKVFKTLIDAQKYRDEFISNNDFYYNNNLQSFPNTKMEFRINGANIGIHPFHIVNENDMPLPDPDNVIQPFTNMPSILQPIINPFIIESQVRFDIQSKRMNNK